jgi:hypothetical protein
VSFLLAYFYLGSSFAYAFAEVSETGKLHPSATTCLRALIWPVAWIPWILVVLFKGFNRK